MVLPEFVNVISFVELMVVEPKSMPRAAPARFNSRRSMPCNVHLQLPSIFSRSSGPLTASSPSGAPAF